MQNYVVYLKIDLSRSKKRQALKKINMYLTNVK